jgi:predicted NUDIX family NTP pyrophosphohydrolase
MATKKVSAGLLMYHRLGGVVQVFLAHPGGPFFARKDDGVWSIPKGEIEGADEPVATARREFEEETGITAEGELVPLGWVRQKGGKVVHAWAFAGALPPGWVLRSNTFQMQWPPGSGRVQEFPEIDRAQFFDVEIARRKILSAQAAFLDRLLALMGRGAR